MKKQFFTFLMMIALVIVAGSAMAQSSTNPYQGGKYTYTISTDNAGVDRLVKIYIATEAAPTTGLTLGAANAVTISNALPAGTQSASGAVYSYEYPDGNTSFSFDVVYGSSISGAHRLWVEIYDNVAGTSCFNAMYKTVTPTPNNFDLALTTPNTSVCQTKADPLSGLAELTAATNGLSTTFTYVVTKLNGGDDTDDWSFEFDLAASTVLGMDIANITSITPSITTGSGGTNAISNTGTLAGGDYVVRVNNSQAGTNATAVTLTIVIPNNTGLADAPFAATILNQKLFSNQDVNPILTAETTTAPAGTNNTGTVTVEYMPTIGGFVGN